MRTLAALMLVVLAGSEEGAARPLFQQEVVAEVRIQGNLLTPDDEVRQLAGIEIGMPVTAETPSEVTARLQAANRFRRVEVLKRFASISDPTQIVLVVIVDDGPVRIEDGGAGAAARVVRRRGPGFLYLPLLRFEDGYGFSYGVRVTDPDFLGRRSRLSFPLTWGGDKRAAAEVDKNFLGGPVSRIETGISISRQEHPFYGANDDRRRVWVVAERDLGGLAAGLRAGATAGWQHVAFAEADDDLFQTGADLIYDTRLDPVLARNAVYARAAWERTKEGYAPFSGGEAVNQTSLDVRGYIGLIGQNVLVVRAVREDSDGPVPPYLKPMLGGMPNLRGFRRGTAVGDTLAAGSVELRMPLSSPIGTGKFGVSAFVDVGSAYDVGSRLRDQRLERAVGGGVWFSAAFVHLNLAVARGLGGLGGSTRVHFGAGVSP
jgi:outer membrane protein assembly factor BamA